MTWTSKVSFSRPASVAAVQPLEQTGQRQRVPPAVQPAVAHLGRPLERRLPVAADQDGYGLGRNRRHLHRGHVKHLAVELEVPAGRKPRMMAIDSSIRLPRPSQGTSSSW